MIREHLSCPSSCSSDASARFCTGIFDASLVSSLLFTSQKFGILTTGPSVGGMKASIDRGVSSFLGSSGSERYAGCFSTDLGVLELRDASKRTLVECRVKQTAAKIAKQGAEYLILGCAGFAGMEGLVQEGVREAGIMGKVRVVDGAKAGLAFLAAQILQERAVSGP
jgi:Asp/Glu/hydantoin racemase